MTSGRRNGKTGIALAGGGPLGGIYEVGALLALERALTGLELTGCDVYVGVSSGAFVAALLANGISPSEMYAMCILDRSHSDPFEPEVLMRPAFGEFARGLWRVPELMQAAAWSYFGATPTRGFFESFLQLIRGLPNGLFDNDAIAAYLARLLSQRGRSDDFRKLKHQLFIVAADLDSGKSTPFGAPGLDHVPISQAVKASAALPGLYPPARIGDRDYVDGAMKKTLHASVALKAGAKLLICVNPLVPFDADLAQRRGGGRPIRLADRGLIAVLSQTFRALIQSRMQIGMARYAREYPDADVILFEPAKDDPVIFFANMFSYVDRRRLAEHAYRHTLKELKRRAGELAPVLARHGVALDAPALAEDEMPRPDPSGATGKLWDSVRPLAATLGELERTLGRARPGRPQGGKRYAGKPSHASAEPQPGARRRARRAKAAE
ncbi:MAG: patatin-like phospholipase family protein [Hyphomicrobiales bacterium]|nr:patatin-like phospholipase family protein [Hyphomicrobiales bacterium]